LTPGAPKPLKSTKQSQPAVTFPASPKKQVFYSSKIVSPLNLFNPKALTTDCCKGFNIIIYHHIFAESHGYKAVDECLLESCEAGNRKSHSCKGVAVYRTKGD
jgi:hypothetical protein